MPKISDLTQLTKENVTSPSQVLLAGADVQAATPGDSRAVGADDLTFLARTEVRSKTSLGLVAVDV